MCRCFIRLKKFAGTKTTNYLVQMEQRLKDALGHLVNRATLGASASFKSIWPRRSKPCFGLVGVYLPGLPFLLIWHAVQK